MHKLCARSIIHRTNRAIDEIIKRRELADDLIEKEDILMELILFSQDGVLMCNYFSSSKTAIAKQYKKT
jgi:hypothetical protein